MGSILRSLGPLVLALYVSKKDTQWYSFTYLIASASNWSNRLAFLFISQWLTWCKGSPNINGGCTTKISPPIRVKLEYQILFFWYYEDTPTPSDF